MTSDDVERKRRLRKSKRRDNTLQVEVSPMIRESPRRGALTMLSGSRPGMVIPIKDEGTTVGRTGEVATVAIEDESLSRCHARFFSARGRYFVEDLESTNGTFVDGRRIREPVMLEEGVRVQLGRSVLLRFTLQDETELAASRDLYEATVRDALTGVFNRHYLEERLRGELSYAKRHGTSLSVLFVDADHFKRVNDTWGHAAGDEVLRRLAATLVDALRSEDVVARIGGEEFVLVLRGIATAGVRTVAERVRAEIEALEIVYEGQRIPLTVSVGAATQNPEREFETAEELVAVADAALYRAKEAGRNSVFFA